MKEVVLTYPLGRPEDIPLNLPPEEAEERGVMYAVRPEWKDIPDWGDRKDCPLLSLLPEILDELFGLPSSLSIADYVALAGTCKFFRKHLGERFFEVLLGQCKGVSSTSYHKLTPRALRASHPFSRPNCDTDPGPGMPPIHRTIQNPPKAAEYFIPPSPRKQWTKEEYLRYRVEKKRSIRDIVALRRQRITDALYTKEVPQGVELRRNFRIAGLPDGGHAIRTGYAFKSGDRSYGDKRDPMKDEAVALQAALDKVFDAADEAAQAYEEVVREVSAGKAPGDRDAVANSAEGRSNADEWTVPDTDDDEDEFEWTDYDPGTGEQITADYAPSAWRRLASTMHTWCDKRRALEKYKVTRAELLSIKSMVAFCSQRPIHIDPRQQMLTHEGPCSSDPCSSYRSQSYNETSLRSLALRAHGGPLGHAKHMREASTDMPSDHLFHPTQIAARSSTDESPRPETQDDEPMPEETVAEYTTTPDPRPEAENDKQESGDQTEGDESKTRQAKQTEEEKHEAREQTPGVEPDIPTAKQTTEQEHESRELSDGGEESDMPPAKKSKGSPTHPAKE